MEDDLVGKNATQAASGVVSILHTRERFVSVVAYERGL